MSEYSIYQDIAKRTDGDIYLGVVGPVRSGKSTFIKKFMESVVLPNLSEGFGKDRARDELPQSAAGKTVMTTEPKFIPEEAVALTLGENVKLKVRLIDCVGYMIPKALGSEEEGIPRMVRTPWQTEAMPFEQAAEIGTQKVISEHSTIGILVTTDGSIGEFPRSSYLEAEARVAKELKELGKPFAILLNSANPQNEQSVHLAYELEEKYGAPVALVNCLELDAADIEAILGQILGEFPVSEISVSLPEWAMALTEKHPIRASIGESLVACASKVAKMGDFKSCFAALSENPYIGEVKTDRLDMGTGTASISVKLKDELYYQSISEMLGEEVRNEKELFTLLKELTQTKKKYRKVAEALEQVNATGYGIVMPEVEDLHLEEPQIVKQSGGYGVKLHAAAQSIHMIKANIETEIHPMVGTEEQSSDLVKYLLDGFSADPKSIWNSNLFGKSLYELVNEGLHTKLEHIPEDSRAKLSETLERIINEGSRGLVCILL